MKTWAFTTRVQKPLRKVRSIRGSRKSFLLAASIMGPQVQVSVPGPSLHGKNTEAQRGQLAAQGLQLKRSISILLLRCLDFLSSPLFIIYCVCTERGPPSLLLLPPLHLGWFHAHPVEWTKMMVERIFTALKCSLTLVILHL